MRGCGGVWFDPSIRSEYVPRATVGAVARQFLAYGRSRAATVRKHPAALSWRQLLPPALLVGLASPARRQVATVYLSAVGVRAALDLPRTGRSAVAFAGVLPVMHLSWAVGFLDGMLRPLISSEHPGTPSG